MKAILSSLATLMLASGMIALTAGPASAAPAVGLVAPLAPAPSCAQTVIEWYGSTPRAQRAVITNFCTRAVRVKVIWHVARDSDCISIARGDTKMDHSGNTLARYDKTVTC